MTSPQTAPLAGLRLVAIERFGAGPYATGHFADLGADVIRIEHTGSGLDAARLTGPYFLGENDSLFYQAFNGNKRSLSLDLKSVEGREIFERLVATADGVLDNLRGDQPDKLKITYEDLKAIKPDVVCAHISAYGREDERASWPGYDYLMQAEAGFLSMTGEPDTPPSRFGLSMVDFMTGMTAAFALLAGIVAARGSGTGRDIDVSLYDVAMHQLTYPAAWYLNEGHITDRVARSGHPYVVPSQLCKTADGWIFIMCQAEKFWTILTERMERTDLGSDPRFVDLEARHQNRQALSDILDDALSARTTSEWIEIFAGDVPCGPVNDIAQALDNPYFVRRGGIRTMEHPDKDDLKVLASPIRMGAPVQNRPAPKLGADSEDILVELGYSSDEIKKLKDGGIL
jgi:crotonobetainyl-CoA:carnitine CoA-transferase CaiB-like acyl-CoA transferase